MTLEQLLAASAATDAFKRDVLAFASRLRAERILVTRHAPHIKVLRVLTQLLHAHPELAIAHVRVHGVSGCADFVGSVDVRTSDGRALTFEFAWDCAWRARELGWTDCFGFPDQIRAAREHEWRCFRQWGQVRDEELLDGALAPA
jgi:hypothetical protein